MGVSRTVVLATAAFTEAGGERQALLMFVAELGNDSVGIVDLKEGWIVYRLAGLSEPQGLAYHALWARRSVGGPATQRLGERQSQTPRVRPVRIAASNAVTQ